MKWLTILCLTGPVFFLAATIYATKAVVNTNTATVPPNANVKKLPLCPPTNTEVSNTVKVSNILLVSTLDGQLSALDLDKAGAHLWSFATGPGPMLSSTISQVELTNSAQFVKLIPSLAGGIYRFDGHSVEPVPMTAEALLKSSFKFADNTVISGGKESRTYGIDLNTGRVIYECTIQGCSRDENEPEDKMQDVLVIQREGQTVRAIEPRTGAEKWNFSVSQHHIQFHPSIEEMCEATVTDEVDEEESDESMVNDDNDYSVNEDGVEIKAVVSEGIICQTEKEKIVWRHVFPSPIVNAWRLLTNAKISKVNLFSNAHIPRRDFLSANDEAARDAMPLIFIGSYKNQLYIQESERQRRRSAKFPYEQQMLPYSEYPRVSWKPYLISASSRTPIINHGSGPPSGLPLLTHDKKTAENTALAVIADAGTEYPFDSGLYLFPDEANLDYDFVEDYKNNSINGKRKKNGSKIPGTTANSGDNEDDDSALTLWNWWKEVVFISIFTAFMMNLLITQPAINRIRENFRITLERINTSQPVLLVERGIEVKVEVPVPQLLREESSSSSNTVIGATSNRSSEFVSRFLTDFEPLRCLGHGGFGVVFESKNKLDDVHYAVKRVQLPLKEEAKKKVMREVKFLAKLDHRNIVRYYNTWLECPPPEWQKTWDVWWKGMNNGDEMSPFNSADLNATSNNSELSQQQQHQQHHHQRKHLYTKEESSLMASSETNDDSLYLPHELSNHGDDSSFRIVFEESDKQDDTTSGGIVFEESKGHDSFSREQQHDKRDRNRRSSSDKRGSSLDDNSCNSAEVCEEAIDWDEARRPRSYLYIVMQLCQRESLRHWLKINWNLEPEVRMAKARSIFHELCLGVQYVHNQGLIHRDLKPSNIFFSSDGTVKIGDFGLVTVGAASMADNGLQRCGESSASFELNEEDLSHSFNSPDDPRFINQHTDQVGTELYMSPEQVSRKSYNHKVDIYSLGMILFELLVPLQTQSERIKTLYRIRNLKFPSDFPLTSESDLVRKMVSHDPSSRPDAADILSSEFLTTVSPDHVRRDSEHGC